jgi:hypothetical protein
MCRLVLIATMVTALGCSVVDREPVAASDRAIVGGTSDAGEDLGLALLWLLDEDGELFALCSASAITRRVLLTAGHCADETVGGHIAWFTDAWDPRDDTFPGLVDSVERRAVERWVHPNWSSQSQPGDGDDIALLLLDQPIPAAVQPLPWNRERIATGYVGRQIRLAGFGQRSFTAPTPDAVKMTAVNLVSSVNAHEIFVTGGTMVTSFGDSGGPAFLTVDGREVVAGVTSWGVHVGDGSDIHAYGRVDQYLDEIDAFIAEHDPQTPSSCGADGLCGYLCADVDPDCPCSADDHCTTACDNPDRDPDCPLGCRAGGTCVREGCAVRDPDCGDKVAGEACTGGNECLSGVCAPNGSARVCADRCGTGDSCGDGFTCMGGLCLGTPAAEGGGGGCAVAAGGRSGWLATLSLLALVAVRRRRPR